MANPLWVSLVVFLLLLARRRPAADLTARLARWVLAVVIAFLALSSVLAIKQAQGTFEARAQGRDYLLKLAAQPEMKPEFGELFRLYPGKNPFIVVERYPLLKKERLSLWNTKD
jgi:hypothetical protein